MKKPAALPDLDHPTLDAASIRRSLYNRLIYTIGKDPITATDRDWFYAAAAVVRERMIERWMETMRSYYVQDRKRVYYLSMEFLMGRTMTNSMLNICAEQEFHDALAAGLSMALLGASVWRPAVTIGIVTALNPLIGYENATAVAKEAHDTGKGVAEIVLARGLLTKEQLDEVLRPENLTQPGWFKK